MNFKQVSGSVYNALTAPPMAGASEPEASGRRLERSRVTILYGWIISMVGIVLYCLVMSSGDQEADLLSALAARGGMGWLSFAIIAIGVGVWAAGCVGFVRESELENCDLPAAGDNER